MAAAEAEIKQSLYRKYRPQTFTEVVGQEHVARTLSNAVAAGTVAHGYVFAGPRGTGKTSMARILAKALNCVGADQEHHVSAPTTQPCGACPPCREIAATTALDVIEMDAASNRSIDDIRELRDRISFAPVRDRFKAYIIDEAHMLTREAFNALLKTLEEPPANVVFVLATTEAHKLPDTIVSRCQRFDFHRPTTQAIAGLLRRIAASEGVDIEDEALETIAEHSDGGFRDAIGALDRLTAYTDTRIQTQHVLEVLGITDTSLLTELTDLVIDADTAAALEFVHRLYERGTNYTQFITDLLRHLRRLFLLQNLRHATDDPALLRALGQNVGLHARMIAELEPQAHQIDPGALVRFMELLGNAQSDIKAGLDARLQLELALVKMTRPQVDASRDALHERLRRLESGADAATPRRQPQAARRAATSPGAAGASTEAAPVEEASVGHDEAAAAAAAPAATGETGEQRAGAPKAGSSRRAGRAADQAPAEAAADVGPPAEPVADEALLEQVQRAWQPILQRVKERNAPLAALLRDAQAMGYADGVLHLAVPSDLARGQVQDATNAALLAEVIAETTGRRLRLEPSLARPPQQPPQAAKAQPEALSLTEAIAQATKKLDARRLPDEE